MTKRVLVATLAVFLFWCVADIVIHGILLNKWYAASPELFRPMAEMKSEILYPVVLISAFVLVWIYARFCNPKSLQAAVAYGTWFGVGTGISMGYGTYAVMPIPFELALGWLLGTVFEAAAGGLLTGLIVKPANAEPPAD